MDVNKILTADILDIVFEGRNKEYGAYQLRRTYNKRITYAIIGTVLVCLLFLVGSLVANSGDKDKTQIFVEDVSLEDVKQEDKKPEPRPHLHLPNRSHLKWRSLNSPSQNCEG